MKYVFCIPVALFVVKTVYKACCRLKAKGIHLVQVLSCCTKLLCTQASMSTRSVRFPVHVAGRACCLKKKHVARMTVTKQVPTVGTCNGLLVPTDELTLAALVVAPAITGSCCCSGGRPRCIRLKGVHVQRLQSFSLVELLPPSWAHTVGLGRLLWRLLQLSVYVSWAHSVCLHFRTSALTLAGLVIGRSPELAREAVVVRMVVPGASVWRVSMYNG